MGAVVNMLRWAVKVSAGAVPTALVPGSACPRWTAWSSPPCLMLGVVCWVIGSGTRTERVSRLLLAWRGTAVEMGLVPALNRLVDPVTRR